MAVSKILAVGVAVVCLWFAAPAAADSELSGIKRRLYVVTPGIRNYLEFGGAGVLVFDADYKLNAADSYKFLRRIPTPASRAEKPENIKGVCASATPPRLFFTTISTIYCLDLLTEESLWERKLEKGCDRLNITPDGRQLFVPSFEKDIWTAVDAATGEPLAEIRTDSGAHNTVCGLDGKHVYMAGLRSPYLAVADTNSHELVAKAGPFSQSIRPFTVNGSQTRCYVCVNGLLGFEIGDLKTGEKLARVEVEGFEAGPVKRHGCPSHGIGLTPDEREIWLCDGHNSRLHVFDLTQSPPKQVASLAVREQPGWVTFNLDGTHALSSTGEVFDVKTRKIIATLSDEEGREVHSEKMLEVMFHEGRVLSVGNQFGVGRVEGGEPNAKPLP